MSEYINEHGTRTFIDSDMSSKDLTDAINGGRTAAALEDQNKLYEKELKNNKAFHVWTIVITAIGTAVSIASLIISLCK